MIKKLHLHLVRFGKWLRERWIRLVAAREGLSDKKIEERFGRPCIVCKTRFTPRFTHHHLCRKHESSFLKCWSPGCRNYFKIPGERFSETYCPECRNEGYAQDLLRELIEAGQVEELSWWDRASRPVFEGPEPKGCLFRMEEIAVARL